MTPYHREQLAQCLRNGVPPPSELREPDLIEFCIQMQVDLIAPIVDELVVDAYAAGVRFANRVTAQQIAEMGPT